VSARCSLDHAERLVKTLGIINDTPDFKGQSLVVNGFSNWMVDVFGEAKGRGVRSLASRWRSRRPPSSSKQ
jgi:hypothetical protein